MSLSPQERTLKAPLHDRCHKCHQFTIMSFASDFCIKCDEADVEAEYIRRRDRAMYSILGEHQTYTLLIDLLIDSQDKNYK